MKRTASAIWNGSLKEGKGAISSKSGVLKNTPYGFTTRFADEPGTNPEELVAAAHAGCFAMAFSATLGRAGFTPEEVNTDAAVNFEKVDDAFTITDVHLTLRAKVPGIDQVKFAEIAEDAKKNCPISRVLNAKITLDAKME